MAPSGRTLFREGRFALIAPVAALVAYLPTVVVPYAYMDDYFVLGWRRGFGGDFFRTATSFGRPLHALFLWSVFSLAPDIDSLRLVRLVALVGVMSLAVLLYYALRLAGLGEWLSSGVCVSVVALASFQVYVSWAALFEAPYVACIAGVAWLRLGSAFGLRGRAGLVRRIEAAALLLVALLTYQPAAMFFWVFAAIDVLSRPGHLHRAARKLGEGLAVGGVAMFFAYAAVRVGVHFYGGATAGRTNLVHDLIGKVHWFWNEPLVNSFGMFGLVPTVSVGVVIALVAAGGIVLLHAESGWGAWGFLGLAACLVPLSYLPNLAVAEDFASYRSIGALSALLTLYLWLGLWGIARWVPRSSTQRVVALALAALLSFVALALVILPLSDLMHSASESRLSIHRLTSWPELVGFGLLFAVTVAALWGGRSSWRRSAVPLVAGALALTGVVMAARNVTTLVVEPQSAELQMLRSALDDTSPPRPCRVVLVKPNWTQGAAPLVRYDEFGPPSTYFPWVPNPAVLLVLRERQQCRNPTIEVLAWDQAPATRGEEDTTFVDMRELQKRRVGWSLWTFHPPSRTTARVDAPSAR